ncbi:hypothetical protein GGF42_003411 [Coemansia sp. RSA 2424]|nr:hypothetical protein GGF42_003411 [Coemansia sp. RSA 2424]
MQTLSPFQTLPLHVAQLVVDHVVSSSRLRFAGVTIGSQRYLELQIPLLWVCRNFRVIVYSCFSSRYEIHFQRGMGREEITRFLWPRCFKGFDRPTQHHVKELVLHLDPWGIYIGKALEMLNSAFGDGHTFPVARKLKITFSREPMQRQQKNVAADLQRVQANIDAFAQRIRQLVPMANEVGLRCWFYAADLPVGTGHCFSSLVTQLYQLSARIVYTSYNNSLPIELHMDKIGDLVHIVYDVNGDNCEQTMQLARRNALTLKSLAITSRLAVDMSGLVRGADGAFTEYPCLQTLKLSLRADPAVSNRPTFKGALPFPKLRHLEIAPDSPFGDDTLFRGNAATLEYLRINLDQLIIDILSRKAVFTPTSHPKLQCVKVEHIDAHAPGLVVAAVDYMHLALSIAPDASVREIRFKSSGASLQAGLSSLRAQVAVQVLVLPKLCLSLWDVIALVTALPLLSDLHTMPPNFGQIPDGVSQDQLSSYVCSTYAPMGKRFRCWRVGYSWGQNAAEAMKCVQLLMLVCPNFTHIVPPFSDYRRAASPTVQTNVLLDFEE